MKSKLLLVIVLFMICCIDAYKILLLTPLGSKSHLNAYMGMFERLPEVGHELTIVSAYGISKKINNIRHIATGMPSGSTTLAKNVFAGGNTGVVFNILLQSPDKCVDSLASDAVQDLKKEQFDLILLSTFLSDCFLSLVHHFQVPLVYISPAGLYAFFSESVGNLYFISLSGHILLEGEFPFGYFYRLKSTLLDIGINSIYTYYTSAKTESLCRTRGLCPQDMPGFQEIKANASLSISNSIKLLARIPIPDMPHIIYAGGSHCGPAKPLPQELEEWINDIGEDGFIFFSLGSAVTPSDMPESARQVFINVFGKLKQKVLWKWNNDMDKVPSNVKLGKWFPQQDILAHPKMRLFISHGGLLSVMETTYHGAKLLGMPLFADQHSNIAGGVNEGWAEILNWKDLTEELLEKKIIATINNEKMKEVVTHRSKIMNDRPMPPKEEALYWIEYVLRHNGAAHLRSPIHHMPFYVLYNVDVWLSLFGIVVGLLVILRYAVRAAFRLCFKKAQVVNKKKKKQ